MKKIFNYFAIAISAFAMLSCNKEAAPIISGSYENDSNNPVIMTKSSPIDTIVCPKIVAYVETNDTNPLNAGDYFYEDTTIPVIDIVELFAANIHTETVAGATRPTLYLNDKLTNVLENNGYLTYVAPLQAKGIKVLLTILGDWAHFGVASMSDTQSTQFATILAYVVDRYGLDGIGFDDEYANYYWYSYVSGSYGSLIAKLRTLLPNKLITVFQWGNYSQINSTQGGYIDYAYHGWFGYNSYYSSSYISGVGTSQWSPISLQLGQVYTDNQLETIAENAADAKAGGYGAVMTFNLRQSSDVDPVPVLQAIVDGFGTDGVVDCNDGDRDRDATIVSSGYTITYAMATAN